MSAIRNNSPTTPVRKRKADATLPDSDSDENLQITGLKTVKSTPGFGSAARARNTQHKRLAAEKRNTAVKSDRTEEVRDRSPKNESAAEVRSSLVAPSNRMHVTSS